MAIGGESVADAQLHRFRSQPSNAGRTCSQGLWNYSRHPNYFFEWLHWFSYVAWALPYDWGWLSLMAPVVMFYLLFSVTGIPYAEKRALLNRGDEYRTYQKRTHAFFPFFHKTAHIRGASGKRGHAMKNALRWAERGLLPDALIRTGIRKLLARRLVEINPGNCQARTEQLQQFIATMDDSPIALHTREANEQHYELPPAFFEKVLGSHLKHSSCYYPTGKETLDEAEVAMLQLYGERAELADGMDILRAGLWLGFAHFVDGFKLSQQPDYGSLEPCAATQIHRRSVCKTRH